jgi:hypothetical protein
MIRNPLDNILSIYLTDIEYSCDYTDSDLNKIYAYYKFWKNIIKEWKSKYPNKIYDYYYDNLVNEPKKYIKELIDYVGFEWSDKYLKTQKSKIKTNTSSVYQIRQGIYKTSSKRWKNYKDNLKGIIKKLNEDCVDYN